MRLLKILPTLAVCAATLSLPAQEAGYWRATSTTAKGITGDIAFGPNKLIINFNAYPIAELRAMTPTEISAVFNPDDPSSAVGHLYKLEIGPDRKFNHKNTLCGSDTVEYMATAITGRELHVALFSGKAIPQLTIDAMNSSTDNCGTFTYTR